MSAINLDAPLTFGAVLGSTGSDSLLREINSELGNQDFFNDLSNIYNRGRQILRTKFINPIRDTIKNRVKKRITNVEVPKIKPIVTEEDLKAIPSCMHDPILRFEPVRQLFDQGRIFGFGHDFIPEGDPYDRLIHNGRITDVASAIDKNGMAMFEWEWHSDDPDLDFDELDCVEETREFLMKFLEESDIDPTDYPELKG